MLYEAESAQKRTFSGVKAKPLAFAPTSSTGAATLRRQALSVLAPRLPSYAAGGMEDVAWLAERVALSAKRPPRRAHAA